MRVVHSLYFIVALRETLCVERLPEAHFSEFRKRSDRARGPAKSRFSPSDRRERLVRPLGQFDTDLVAAPDVTAGQHDAHDAGLALQIAGDVARQGRRHQTRLEFVELPAWVAQPGHLDNGLVTEI